MVQSPILRRVGRIDQIAGAENSIGLLTRIV